jgi:hypothetical protein
MKELDGDAALNVEEVRALIPSRRYGYSTLKHAGKALSKFGYDLVPGKFGTDNKKEILSLKDGCWILQVKYWMGGQPCNVNPPNTQYHCIVFLAAWRMLVDNDEYGSVVEIDPKRQWTNSMPLSASSSCWTRQCRLTLSILAPPNLPLTVDCGGSP